MSLAKARTAANGELRKIDGGLDPQVVRTEAKRAAQRAKADSIEALCETFIEEYARPRKRTWRARPDAPQEGRVATLARALGVVD